MCQERIPDLYFVTKRSPGTTYLIEMNRSVRNGYLPHWQTAKPQASLGIHAVYPDSLLFAQSHMSHVMRKPVYAICEQQRSRSACASTQSDQRLCCSLSGLYNTSTGYSQNFKTLVSSAEQGGLSRTPQRQVFTRQGSYGIGGSFRQRAAGWGPMFGCACLFLRITNHIRRRFFFS